VTAWRFGARNGVQAFFTGHGTPCAIANPVQAHVRGNPVQETRRISRVEPFASFENAEEYVLTRVERFVLIAQKLRQRRSTIGPYRRLASSVSSSFTLAV
jgi:hypothetical protein